VRSATQADEQFLQEMVLHAAFPPGATTPTLEDVLQDQRLAR
jgi:hypothetical protein